MQSVTSSYSGIWNNCLSLIKERTSDEEYTRWFKPIVPVDFDGSVLKLRVPNESFVYQIERNYIPFLRPIIQQLFGAKTRLRYSIPDPEPEVQAQAQTNSELSHISAVVAQNNGATYKNPFIIPGIKKVVIDPQLNPNYCFDNFVEGECNRLTRSAGLSIAITPGNTPFNPLFIYGDSGLGKTHVAQAIGLEAKQRHPDLKVLYVSTNKFQAQFQNAAVKGELNDFIHFYQMIDVLIVDDIQELAGKEKTQNAFFNIFNHLHLSHKQLILTSDKPPVELKDIEQRLITRFKWGLSTQLVQPDYETKVKIIKAKASRSNVQLDNEVVEFLAANIESSVREIEGALTALIANTVFLGKKPTIALTREVLKMYVKYTHKEVSIDSICSVVCDHFDITKDKFNSKLRTREIALARQIAMHLSKTHTKLSLSAIGLFVGNKNHATVLHACKTVSNLLETDKSFREQMEEIERKVLAK